jgi:hypothetical protein
MPLRGSSLKPFRRISQAAGVGGLNIRTNKWPMPSPPAACASCDRTWENISKTCSRAAGGMPIPVSCTRAGVDKIANFDLERTAPHRRAQPTIILR